MPYTKQRFAKAVQRDINDLLRESWGRKILNGWLWGTRVIKNHETQENDKNPENHKIYKSHEKFKDHTDYENHKTLIRT